MNMKKNITILLVLPLMMGCFGASPTTNSSIESKVQLDAVPLTRYEYKMRGNHKTNMGDIKGGIEDYTRAIMVDPLYDTAYYNRANNKVSLGNQNGALVDYAKAIKLNQHFTSVYINRGVLKSEMGDNEAAIADFRLAIKYGEPDADLYNNLGRALYDLNRFKESADAYGDGIKYFPEDYRLYYGRGLARKRTGDNNGACEDWIKSSELGCIQANILLPLCDEYIKEKKDSLKRQEEQSGRNGNDRPSHDVQK